MPSQSALGRVRTNIVEIFASVHTAFWLTLLFVGPGNLWLPVMLIGYIAVIPVLDILFNPHRDDDEELAEGDVDHQLSHEHDTTASTAGTAENHDALDQLRERYAAGELTDEQFERKLEKLLETETIEDVEKHVQRERETETERI